MEQRERSGRQSGCGDQSRASSASFDDDNLRVILIFMALIAHHRPQSVQVENCQDQSMSLTPFPSKCNRTHINRF